MSEFRTGNREAAAIRELTAEEIALVSGGSTKGSKTKEQPQVYLVATMQDCFVSSW